MVGDACGLEHYSGSLLGEASDEAVGEYPVEDFRIVGHAQDQMDHFPRGYSRDSYNEVTQHKRGPAQGFPA